MVARGAAYGDFDHDGDLDVLLATNNGPAYLYRNDGGNRNHWLQLKLVGTKSNRNGIGAVARVTSAGGTQSQTVHSGSSYCSASDLALTFGLGKDTQASAIEIQWPSGTHQKLTNVPANQHLVDSRTMNEILALSGLAQGAADPRRHPLFGRTGRRAPRIKFAPVNPALNAVVEVLDEIARSRRPGIRRRATPAAPRSARSTAFRSRSRIRSKSQEPLHRRHARPPQRSSIGVRRDPGRPPARRRSHPHRPHQPARSALRLRKRQPDPRPHQ